MRKKLNTILQVLLLINALIWFVSGGITLFSGRQYILSGINLYLILSVLMFLNAFCLVLAAKFITKKSKIIFPLVVLLVLINFILSFTDQLGLMDFLVIGLNSITLILLFKSRMKPTLF